MTDDQKPERIRHKRHSAFFRFRIARRIRGSMKSPPRYRDFERFCAGLSGDLPAKGPEGVILAACNDYYYWHFAITLVLSVELQGERQKLHLHLCEPAEKTLSHVERLRSELRHVELTFTWDRAELAAGLVHRTVYYASARFLLAPLLLEKTGAPLLCIDVDGIAVKPVWPAYEAARSGCDVALIRRPDEKKPTMKILASAVGFNPTPRGLGFAADLGRSLAAILAIGPGYHIDQIAIHYLLQEPRYRSGLSINAMPDALWNHDFDPAAAIWTAKGWSRKESSAFLEAKNRVDARFPDLQQPR